MNKFAHIRRATVLDGSHRCNWPGCKLEVPLPHWGCEAHWLLLPKDLRSAIWRAYEIGQEADARLVTPDYEKAAAAARRNTTEAVP